MRILGKNKITQISNDHQRQIALKNAEINNLNNQQSGKGKQIKTLEKKLEKEKEKNKELIDKINQIQSIISNIQPPTPPGRGKSGGGNPWYKKTWILWLIIFILIVSVLYILCFSNKNNEEDPNNIETESVTDNHVENEISIAEYEVGQKDSLKVGDKIHVSIKNTEINGQYIADKQELLKIEPTDNNGTTEIELIKPGSTTLYFKDLDENKSKPIDLNIKEK